MKLIHLSDLHLGKRLNEFSLLEDQRYILAEIVRVVGEERPEGVILAGDIYDKSMPSAEAVELFDDFLVRLVRQNTQVFLISGNHDSAERIAFGGRLMMPSGVHVAPVYGGQVYSAALEDRWGTVCLYMLPFIKPVHVRRFYPDAEISTYTDALRTALAQLPADPQARNVLITHQFVTGAQRSDSEEISVGGSDNVDAAVFDSFDYVALGHIHGPQQAGRETVRYCGTPLKYSFSEMKHIKSVTVVELAEKGSVQIRTVPLKPLRDLREIRGFYLELTNKANYENTPREDYLRAVLTDENSIPDAMAKLRIIYPNLMTLEYDNARTRSRGALESLEHTEQKKQPLELFAQFYEKQNNQSMNAEQTQFLRDMIEKTENETEEDA
ncbi:MAG: exonuclease SbcCD subunit D [Oscillospiraceae bacterium]|nr:exonuclease SbcCD subunit D [Oscillospiraceae bacterium]